LGEILWWWFSLSEVSYKVVDEGTPNPLLQNGIQNDVD
jgi:hypothetical protein